MFGNWALARTVYRDRNANILQIFELQIILAFSLFVGSVLGADPYAPYAPAPYHPPPPKPVYHPEPHYVRFYKLFFNLSTTLNFD